METNASAPAMGTSTHGDAAVPIDTLQDGPPIAILVVSKNGANAEDVDLMQSVGSENDNEWSSDEEIDEMNEQIIMRNNQSQDSKSNTRLLESNTQAEKKKCTTDAASRKKQEVLLPPIDQIKTSASSGAKHYRSGWVSTPSVPKPQKFLPDVTPRETDFQRHIRFEKEATEAARGQLIEQERKGLERERSKLEDEEFEAKDERRNNWQS